MDYITGMSLQVILDDTLYFQRYYLQGIGVAKNTSRELMNLSAAIFAITDLAQQISILVNSMLDDYLSETGTTSQYKLLSENNSLSRRLANVTISHCFKYRDVFSNDGYLVQEWGIPKHLISSVFNEALVQQMRRVLELEDWER
jgi:hypothetical protein